LRGDSPVFPRCRPMIITSVLGRRREAPLGIDSSGRVGVLQEASTPAPGLSAATALRLATAAPDMPCAAVIVSERTSVDSGIFVARTPSPFVTLCHACGAETSWGGGSGGGGGLERLDLALRSGHPQVTKTGMRQSTRALERPAPASSRFAAGPAPSSRIPPHTIYDAALRAPQIMRTCPRTCPRTS
jgi:hypothetical protein